MEAVSCVCKWNLDYEKDSHSSQFCNMQKYYDTWNLPQLINIVNYMKEPIGKYRLAWLDYLRGFCALGIMLYHYSLWGINSRVDVGTFLGKVGVYGVSMFYVLSGLTLYQVYQHKMETFDSIRKFYIKRFFRIFPLLWIVNIATIILNRQIPDVYTLFLNFTGVFGFIEWDNYIAIGAWSIGNELVFYILFPLLCIFSKKKNKMIFFSFSLVVLVLYIYFSFFALNTTTSLDSQWKDYVNPLNQAFFFLGGFLIGFFMEKKKTKNKYLLSILILTILLFIFYPISGNQIHIVTGWNRVVFTFICFSVCVCCYKFSTNLFPIFHYPLVKLGEATYSVYLIHPLIWFSTAFLSSRFLSMNITFLIIVSVILTLLVSLFVYHFFEKKLMKIGENIIKRKKYE